MASINTYAFSSIVGSMVHPLVGPFPIGGGNVGLGSIEIEMLTERSKLETAADGNVMISSIKGNTARVRIEVQQTSPLHQYLLGWYNAVITEQSLQSSLNWASAVVTFVSIDQGITHLCQGVCVGKLPNQPYKAEGSNYVWDLMSGDTSSQ